MIFFYMTYLRICVSFIYLFFTKLYFFFFLCKNRVPNTGLGGHLFFPGVPCGQITSSFCLGDDGVSRVSVDCAPRCILLQMCRHLFVGLDNLFLGRFFLR